jgi:hypothetical protein
MKTLNETLKTEIYWRYGRKLMNGALLAAVTMAAIGTPPAQAEDGKLYPGSMCIRFGGSAPVLNASRLFNHGTTDLLLDCPVVHDFINESIQDGYVDVIDNHATRAVCATLVRVSQFESSTITQQTTVRKCSEGKSFQSQRLSFGGLTADRNAHYFYNVRIPPPDNGLTSAIISYRVDEND